MYIKYKNNGDKESDSNSCCFRNEYPFQGNPEDKDIEELHLEIIGNLVTGTYTFSQEGISKTENIEIVLKNSEAVIKGERNELGLDATIKKIRCVD